MKLRRQPGALSRQYAWVREGADHNLQEAISITQIRSNITSYVKAFLMKQ
ncbi:hypothetical protein P3L10_008399 [Capsicum annuum]